MKKYSRMKVISQMFVVFVIVISSATLACAQGIEEDAAPTRNWSFLIGGAVGMQPVYSGSDELIVVPVPLINAAYSTRYVDAFVSSMEGLGVRFKEEQVTGLSLALGASLGEPRDQEVDEVKEFLRGTPEVVSDYHLFTTLKLALPFGELASTLRWFPVETEYDDAGIADEEYDGLRGELNFGAGLPLNQHLMMSAGIGVTWMNDEYAQAYHGVHYATSKLETFSAEGGLRDVHASIGLTYLFNQHLMAIIKSDVVQLLNDAADSPLTKEEIQPALAAGIVYNF
jgi:outer membrane scaffolding protein for murein synthesis (MipA/OmpV family)